MEHAYGLYTHIQSNRRRSIALLIGLFFLVYVMVYAGALAAEAFMGDASLAWLLARARQDFIAALPWATLGTAAWILIAYRFHQTMIDAITGAREVTRQEEPRLWNLLENLCISRGITMPKLKVVESEALNAFASGLNAKQYSVTVTRGLGRRAARAADRVCPGRHRLAAVGRHSLRAVALARISRRCRFGRTHQKPGRDDQRVAQHRGARRSCGGELGRDGNVPRQSAQ